MKVQDVIDMAISSELSNISARDSTSTILSYLNLGMLELYKRFPIKTDEHIITLVDGVSNYTLPSGFMWIIAVYGEVSIYDISSATVKPLPVNEEDNPLSVNLIGWNTLQVPLATTGAFISVIYASAPDIITEASLNDVIQIPPQMVESLLYYIGYRASAPTDEEGEVNSYYRRFELSCARIKAQGMFTADDMKINKKFARGFA